MQEKTITAINECNAPPITHDTIWLQPDEYPEITWCRDKINDNDIKYLLANTEREVAFDLLKASLEVALEHNDVPDGEKPWLDQTREVLDRVEITLRTLGFGEATEEEE